MVNAVSSFTKLRANPGKRELLVRALWPLLLEASTEIGLHEYSLHACDEDPDEVWFFARFADETAVTVHELRETAVSTPEFLSALLPLLAGPANTSTAQVLWALPLHSDMNGTVSGGCPTLAERKE